MPSEIERVKGGNLNLTRGSISQRKGEREENQRLPDFENKMNAFVAWESIKIKDDNC